MSGVIIKQLLTYLLIYTTRDTGGHNSIYIHMTLILKVLRQGQVNYFSFSGISDIRNAKINTDINSTSQLQVLL